MSSSSASRLGNRSMAALSVSTTGGRAISSSEVKRRSGIVTSSGRYAAPLSQIARIASGSAAARVTATPTTVSTHTPAARNCSARCRARATNVA